MTFLPVNALDKLKRGEVLIRHAIMILYSDKEDPLNKALEVVEKLYKKMFPGHKIIFLNIDNLVRILRQYADKYPDVVLLFLFILNAGLKGGFYIYKHRRFGYHIILSTEPLTNSQLQYITSIFPRMEVYGCDGQG